MDNDLDRAKGKGKMKQAAGDLTDDRDLKRDGKVDERAGQAKDLIENVKDKVSNAIDNVKDKLKKN